MFKKRTQVKIEITVYSKLQKQAFFDIMSDFIEKPIYKSHTKSNITYEVNFIYYVNYESFIYEKSGLYPQYRFQAYRVNS